MSYPNAGSKPVSRPVRSSAGRKELARTAREKATSDLAQANKDLARERAKCAELEKRLQVFEEVSASLQRENSDLSEELKLLRAADIPSLLYSIDLVIQLHALATLSPCTDLADTRQPQSSSPSPMQHGSDNTSLSLDWESPTFHDGSRNLLAEFGTADSPSAGSPANTWPGSASTWSPGPDRHW